jgi:catechol 2,3-dioxygenase-like lactoylglutathione lyase family enzyme
MSRSEVPSNDAAGSTKAENLDMKLEVVVIPVSNVDRAKEFYSRLGWRLDADRSAGDNFRLVQFTPPGSGSSIQFGVNLTSAAPPFGPGNDPRRLRHRGRARGTHRKRD